MLAEVTGEAEAGTGVVELAIPRRTRCARRAALLLVVLINEPGLELMQRFLVRGSSSSSSSSLLWDWDRGCLTPLSKVS